MPSKYRPDTFWLSAVASVTVLRAADAAEALC